MNYFPAIVCFQLGKPCQVLKVTSRIEFSRTDEDHISPLKNITSWYFGLKYMFKYLFNLSINVK